MRLKLSLSECQILQETFLMSSSWMKCKAGSLLMTRLLLTPQDRGVIQATRHTFKGGQALDNSETRARFRKQCTTARMLLCVHTDAT